MRGERELLAVLLNKEANRIFSHSTLKFRTMPMVEIDYMIKLLTLSPPHDPNPIIYHFYHCWKGDNSRSNPIIFYHHL